MTVSLLAYNPDVLIVVIDISTEFSVEISSDPPPVWVLVRDLVLSEVKSARNRQTWRESSMVEGIFKSGGNRVSCTSQTRTLVTRVLEPGVRK